MTPQHQKFRKTRLRGCVEARELKIDGRGDVRCTSCGGNCGQCGWTDLAGDRALALEVRADLRAERPLLGGGFAAVLSGERVAVTGGVVGVALLVSAFALALMVVQ